MAKNRCVLTDEGCEALNRLLTLVYPGGYTETALNADTGLSRDTLDKVLKMLNAYSQSLVRPNQSIQAQIAAMHYVKLEQLFDRLNQKLTDDQKEQHSFKPRYCREICNRVAAPKSRQVSSVASNIPPQQQLARQLSRLNYTTGQAKFQDSLNRLKPAGAFLLQVPDTKVQQWLVRRLAESVAGFENGRKLEINVACLGGNFEALWCALARQLQLSTATAEATIASLSELCQGKTVIITLSRFQRLDAAMQQRLIREFWVPLAQHLRSQQLDWRSRLVLFLVQDSCDAGKFPLLAEEGTGLENPVVLEPLVQIALPDIQGWFEQEGFDLLAVHLGEQEAERFMQQSDFSGWDTHPWITLENICNVFRTEISEIETYWKLAG